MTFLCSAKQDDDELVLQIAYVFYQMIWHEETRNVIVSKTQVHIFSLNLHCKVVFGYDNGGSALCLGSCLFNRPDARP